MGEGEGCARTWVRLPSHPSTIYRWGERGPAPLDWGPRPRGEECLPSQVEALPLRVSPLPCAWALGGLVPLAHKGEGAPLHPMLLYWTWWNNFRTSGPLWNPPEPSGSFPVQYRKNPNFFRNPNNNFPYINLYLRTIPELLVTSGISSGTPNNIR